LYEFQHYCLAAKFAGVICCFLTICSPFYLSCLAVVSLQMVSQLHKLQFSIIEGVSNKSGMTHFITNFITTEYYL